MHKDDIEYQKKQEEELKAHESLCKRCGMCCGAGGSEPCANLERSEDGTYYCRSYETRIGPQVTVTGKDFICVPIQDVLSYTIPYADCGYVKQQHDQGQIK